MTRMEKSSAFSRRALLKTGGALVVSIGMPISLDTVLAISEAHAQAAIKPPLTPDQLSSYIAVNADGTVAAFFGKMDMGHGLFVAIGQMVAEELDVPFKAVKVYMGDTANSVHQGGASGSTGIQLGGKQMRMAAAEARRVLVEMAAQKLSVPADQLTVVDGVIQAKTDPAKKASYAELIGGRYFNVPLEWNKQYGNTLYAPGKAQPKKPSEYKIVGKPIKREDIAPKVFAQEDFVTDVKVPGMVHARMIRPPVAGSVPVKVDESSIKDIPTAKVVWQNGFLAVVADKEWDAIQAMRKPQGGVVAGQAAVPAPGIALRRHPQIQRAQARGREEHRRCGRSVQDRGAGDRGGVRMAVPVPCLHGAGLRLRRDQGRLRDLLHRQPEVALRPGRLGGDARTSAGQGPREVADRPRLVRTQRCRRLRHGCRRHCQGGRAPGTAAIHARSGHRVGPQGPRFGPSRPRRVSMPPARSRPTSSPARGSRGSTSTPMAASRRIHWRARPAA